MFICLALITWFISFCVFADDSDDEVYLSIANNDSTTDSVLDTSSCSMSTSQTSSTAGLSASDAALLSIVHIYKLYLLTYLLKLPSVL